MTRLIVFSSLLFSFVADASIAAVPPTCKQQREIYDAELSAKRTIVVVELVSAFSNLTHDTKLTDTVTTARLLKVTWLRHQGAVQVSKEKMYVDISQHSHGYQNGLSLPAVVGETTMASAYKDKSGKIHFKALSLTACQRTCGTKSPPSSRAHR